MVASRTLGMSVEEYLRRLDDQPYGAVREARSYEARATVAFGSELSARWAEHYLGPYVALDTVTGDGLPSMDLVVHYSSPAGQPRLADGVPVTLHSGRPGTWHDRGSVLVVHHSNAGIAYVIDRERRRAHLVMTAVTPETVREPARHLRELLLNRSPLLRGFRPLHCSGLASADGVVLVVAGKGGGKTSTLVHGIGHAAVDYFCNDRALVGTQGGVLQAYPYPLSCRVGAGTALANPLLATHLHGFDHTMARVLPLDEQVNGPDKLELMPSELAAILGARIRSERLPVRAVIQPRLVLDGRRPETTALSVHDSRAVLTENLLAPDPDRLNWLASEIAPTAIDGAPALPAVPTFRVTGDARHISDVAVGQLVSSATAEGLAPGALAPTDRWLRRRLTATLVVVMEHRRANRDLKLSGHTSRAVRRDDVHEFIVTARGPDFLKAVGYVGFAAFRESGVLVKGDLVSVQGQVLGRLAGFDLTHADNHLNVVIESDRTELAGLPTGQSLGLGLDAELTVERA